MIHRISKLFLRLLVACFLLVACGAPLAIDKNPADLLRNLHHVADSTSEQNLSAIGIQVVVASWVFILGACFGSFLNVVIYRLPAGMSLGKPKSRCPRCETQLAAKDNVPILGWLFLKGKCRYCSLPISSRYPTIETLCGGIFLALMYGELLTGAANLPMREPEQFHVHPRFWLVWFTQWDLLGIYLYHCCLLVVLLATAMIGYDGHRPQKRLLFFALVVGLGAGTVWAELRPVPALPYHRFFSEQFWNDWCVDGRLADSRHGWLGVSLPGFLDGILGLAGGALMSFFVRWQMLSSKHQVEVSAGSAAVASILLISGVFLGWQACGILAMAAIPLLGLTKIVSYSPGDSRTSRLMAPSFFTVVFLFLLFWNTVDDSPWMIGYRGWSFTPLNWWQDWVATIVAMGVFSAVIHIAGKPTLTDQSVGSADDNAVPDATQSEQS